MTLLLKIVLCFGVVLFPTLSAAQAVGTINFDFDSAELDAEANVDIDRIADQLKATDTYKPTVVVGYTDAVGTTAYNRTLGQQRAQVVADALVARGVPVERIGTIKSRGETELLVAVATPERANRRVTVSLDDMLAACRTYRNIGLTQAAIGDALQADLVSRLQTALSAEQRFTAAGGNSDAFQMAGAARADCSAAVGYEFDATRKLEYSKRCFCSSARLQVALNGVN